MGGGGSSFYPGGQLSQRVDEAAMLDVDEQSIVFQQVCYDGVLDVGDDERPGEILP